MDKRRVQKIPEAILLRSLRVVLGRPGHGLFRRIRKVFYAKPGRAPQKFVLFLTCENESDYADVIAACRQVLELITINVDLATHRVNANNWLFMKENSVAPDNIEGSAYLNPASPMQFGFRKNLRAFYLLFFRGYDFVYLIDDQAKHVDALNLMRPVIEDFYIDYTG